MLRLATYLLLLCLVAVTLPAQAAVVVRVAIEPGICAALRSGQLLILECKVPEGPEGPQLLQKYLDPNTASQFRHARNAAIRFDRLHPAAQRQVLLKLFPQDYVDEHGWWHIVSLEREVRETFAALGTWFAGDPVRAADIQRAPQNAALRDPLEKGQRVLIPAALLNPELRKPTANQPAIVQDDPVQRAAIAQKKKAAWPTRPKLEGVDLPESQEDDAAVVPAAAPLEPAMDTILEAAAGELAYTKDRQGEVAVYRLKKGEALYSSVVVRFTNFQENADIHEAVAAIAKRSGLPDPNRVESGQKIYIPLDMLADRYQPQGSRQRENFESIQQEARLLLADRVRTQDLEGCVIVLDAGHGGRDHGASDAASGLYEDELTYDIVARMKHILETQTRARVYVTVHDPSQGYRISNATRFVHDTDEELLTTPRYHNIDARISANLRWYLANRIYRDELKRGTDEKKMLFMSVHCDSLFNDSLRGAMVYVPGADYRRDREEPGGIVYAAYQEVQQQRFVTTTAANRRRDEALSRNFADTLLNALRSHQPAIKVHDTGDPIRNVIRQSGGRAYVPAVLRNTMIPTKILLETANLTNATDRERLADPQWRQWMAEASVDAIKTHFGAASSAPEAPRLAPAPADTKKAPAKLAKTKSRKTSRK